jgi:hypothetical protein
MPGGHCTVPSQTNEQKESTPPSGSRSGRQSPLLLFPGVVPQSEKLVQAAPGAPLPLAGSQRPVSTLSQRRPASQVPERQPATQAPATQIWAGGLHCVSLVQPGLTQVPVHEPVRQQTKGETHWLLAVQA